MVPEETAVTEAKTYTQEELDALVKETNKGLEANRNEVLADLRKAKDALKAFDGMDPEKVRAQERRVAELEQEAKAADKGITSAELDKMRGDVRQQIEKEYSPFKTKSETLAARVRELELDNVVKGLMAKSGVRPERIDALFKLTGDRFDLTDDSKPMLRDAMGKDVEKYISEELELEYPELYQGSKSSGGGASKSTTSGGGRAKEISRSDPDAFMSSVEDVATGKVVVTE